MLRSDSQFLDSASCDGDSEDIRHRNHVERGECFLVTGSIDPFSPEVMGEVFTLVDTPPHSTADSHVEGPASD